MSDVGRVIHQVNQVQNLVVQVERAVAEVSDQVAVVNLEQRATRSDLTQLRADFHSFLRQNRLDVAAQKAETRVGALQDKIEHDFGKYKVVRESAVGMLQAFDIGLISEQTAQAISEQLMIQTPRYWLAPVLVALAAWSRDESNLCERAVETAFQRSPAKTSLFMALVLRRQGRYDSAGRWLRHYLAAQDPTALGRDFAVILESIAQGAFGPAGLQLMQEFLDRWRKLLLNDDSKIAAQIERWRIELAKHVSPAVDGRYPRLAAVSPQWPQMAGVLQAAEAHQSVLAKYGQLLAEVPPPADRLEDTVDDILDRLVREYDDEELPLRRDLALNKAIVRFDGDEEAARHALETDGTALETKLDYLTVQSESALNPDGIGVSRSTQRLAIASCHEWFASAHDGFTRDYRAGLPSNVEAVFDTSHNVGAMTFKLPRWVGSFTQPIENLERSLAGHWELHGRSFLDGLAFKWGKNLIAPIGTVLGVLLLFAICAHPVAGLLLALLAAGIWAAVLTVQKQSADKRQQDAARLLTEARADSLAQLRGAAAELTDWATAFRTADSVEGSVRALINDFGRAGIAATPFARRQVGSVQ